MSGPFPRTRCVYLAFCASLLAGLNAPSLAAPTDIPLALAADQTSAATPAPAPSPSLVQVGPPAPDSAATAFVGPPAPDSAATAFVGPPEEKPSGEAQQQVLINPDFVGPMPDGTPPAATTVAGAVAVPADAPSTAMAAAAPADKNLWDRVRRGFKMPELDTKRTQSSTRWYAAQPDYIARMTGRANMYLYHIVDEIEKRGMPTELALLPFVESAMQPEAVSFAKAAGLWQFIPSTGKLYSLEQNLWKDERFGVIESTRAALDYLQNLYTEFGDWQLALAAYNCGENAVEKALAKARAQHRSLAYKDLRLPSETQFYVPKLMAIKNIVADPQHYGIDLPAISNEPYFVSVNKSLDIDVATAARLADMPLEDFRALNPAFNRPVIVGASSPHILLPADRVETFNANLAAWQATGQPLASWTAYTLQAGETLAAVAERVAITEGQLRDANHIPPRYRPSPGSTILIPRDESTSEDIAPGFVSASFSLVPENGNLRQVTVRVRRGDTLASIARRWHVAADDIVAWNQLHSMSLFAGQRLNLTVAHTAPATVHKVAHKPASSHAHAGTTASAGDASVSSTNATAAAHAAAVSAPSRM